jgi:hypothetical protein
VGGGGSARGCAAATGASDAHATIVHAMKARRSNAPARRGGGESRGESLGTEQRVQPARRRPRRTDTMPDSPGDNQ